MKVWFIMMLLITSCATHTTQFIPLTGLENMRTICKHGDGTEYKCARANITEYEEWALRHSVGYTQGLYDSYNKRRPDADRWYCIPNYFTGWRCGKHPFVKG